MSPADPGLDLDELARSCIEGAYTSLNSLGSLHVFTPHLNAAAVGFGWWARIVRTGVGIVRLHDADLAQEASPLLRTILHHAVALAWLREEPDEVLNALRFEHAARRRRLGQKAGDRGWDLTGIALGSPPSGKRPPGMELLNQFEKMCDRVNARNSYVAYMVESAYAHPSGLSADTYIGTGPEGPHLRASPVIPGQPLTTAARAVGVGTHELARFIGDERIAALADSFDVLG